MLIEGAYVRLWVQLTTEINETEKIPCIRYLLFYSYIGVHDFPEKFN